jgi:hypothetical protein
MRNRGLMMLLVLGAVLGGYATRARSVEAQSSAFSVEIGQRITLSYGDGAVNCDVNAVSGDFVRCDPDGKGDTRFVGSFPRVESWYNLRVARVITKSIPK